MSYWDIVRAAADEENTLYFRDVAKDGGHSTYMLLAPPNSSEFPVYWEKLKTHGCSYESTTIKISLGTRILYSVDVPPDADIYQVYAILEDGERRNVWMFQEGHVGHTLRQP